MKMQTKAFIAAIGAYLIGMGAVSLAPAMQALITTYAEYGVTTVLMVNTLPPLFIAIGNIIAPAISNVISKKVTLIIANVLFLAGVLPAFIPGFEFLLVTRALLGLGIGLMMPLASSIIYLHAENPGMAQKAIGWMNSGGGVGAVFFSIACGALLGVGLSMTFHVHWLGVISLLIVLIFCPQDHPQKEAKEKSKFSVSGGTMFYVVVVFIWIIFFNNFSNFVALKFGEVAPLILDPSVLGAGEEAISAAIGSTASFGLTLFVLGLIVAGIIYGFVANVTKQVSLPIGITLGAIGLFMCGFGESVAIIYIGGFLCGLGMGFTMSSVMSGAAMGAKSPEFIAFAMTLVGLLLTIGQFISAMVVTPLTAAIFGTVENASTGALEPTAASVYILCASVLVVIAIVTFITEGRKAASSKNQPNE